MAIDKAVDSAVLDAELTTIANAIRAKTGGTETLSLDEMAAEIANISGLDASVSEYTQMNAPVTAYLAAADAAYTDDNGDSISVIADYETSENDADRPLSYPLTVASGTLYLQSETTGKGWTLAVNDDYIRRSIANAVPGEVSQYLVNDSDGNLLENGRIKPTGKVRMIKFCGYVRNFRDLGGWDCDGGTVKYGKLFRSAAIDSSETWIDPQISENIGIRHEIDVRDDEEANNMTESTLGSTVRYKRIPLNLYYADSINISKADYENMKKVLRTIIEAAIHNEGVVYHCSLGRDRAGTITFMLLALLGVARADIDKDYELTGFSAANTPAYRTSTTYRAMATYLSDFGGSSLRDNAVWWFIKAGFSVEELNAFRAAMTDGTPETISPSIANCTITNHLDDGISSGNDAANVAQYQPYTAKIKVEDGELISGVTVKMGGVEITGAAWSGIRAKLARAVTYNLANCTSSNKRGYVLDGQSYATQITPLTGYTLDGVAVKITMGGADMAEYYSGGVIAIPNVTGDVEITVTAVASAPQYTNLLSTLIDNDGSVLDGVGYRAGKRWSTSATTIDTASDMDGSYLFGLLPAQDGDIIRIKAPGKTEFSGPYDQIKWFYNDKTAISGYTNYNNMAGTYVTATLDTDSSVVTLALDSPSTGKGAYAYVSIVLQGITDISGVVITKNEDIT